MWKGACIIENDRLLLNTCHVLGILHLLSGSNYVTVLGGKYIFVHIENEGSERLTNLTYVTLCWSVPSLEFTLGSSALP